MLLKRVGIIWYGLMLQTGRERGRKKGELNTGFNSFSWEEEAKEKWPSRWQDESKKQYCS